MARQASANTRREPGKRAVREQLCRITESPDFDTSARSRDFLRFVVKRALLGNYSKITQHAIATDVFGRGEDFDPLVDPIVRMQAGRVRRSLERYYLTSGKNDLITITIPKGTYTPVFEFRQAERPRAVNDTESQAMGDVPDPEPILMIVPFRNLSGDTDFDFIAQGLAPELAVALDRYHAARVILMPQDPLEDAATAEQVRSACCGAACFVVKGSVSTRSGSVRVAVHLVDFRNGVQLWAHEARWKASAPEFDACLDELVQTVAAAIAEEQGIIARQVSGTVRWRPPDEARAYEAVLRAYHFERCPSPQTYRDALIALRHTVRIAPDSGRARTALARLCASNYALEFLPSEVVPIEDSIQFAEEGARLNPDDQRAWCVLSYAHIISGNLESGRRAAEHALTLNPDSLFFLDVIGYLLTLLGVWDRGPALIEKAIRLNPFGRDVGYCGLWLNEFRKKDYEKAYDWAQRFMLTTNHWSPLMAATTLAHMGRSDEAMRAADRLRRLKPNFKEDGHRLIARYVKFDDLVTRIEQGLDKACLRLA